MKKIFTDMHSSLLTVIACSIATSSILPSGFSNRYTYESNSTNMQITSNELTPLTWANTWINSKPLSPSDLKGKVVVIEFWTYTCVNWTRTLPYVRAWSEKYRQNGLVVIGVHTPEFSFEKNTDNVRRAVKEMRIDFPVAIDNNMDVWDGFNNQFWPALYFIDAQQQIRHTQFGEGAYGESEKVIQQLLVEAGARDIDQNLVTVKAQGVEVAADWQNLQSQENYLGHERTENFISPRGWTTGSNVYAAPLVLALNQWALSGKWSITKGSVIGNSAGGKIVYRFHARDLNIVMGPFVTGKTVRFRVYIDGAPPGISHGTDIDDQGFGIISEQRLYQLIRQTGSIVDHTFEIEFLDREPEAFSFTFG